MWCEHRKRGVNLPQPRWLVDAAVLKLHSRRCTCLQFHPTKVREARAFCALATGPHFCGQDEVRCRQSKTTLLWQAAARHQDDIMPGRWRSVRMAVCRWHNVRLYLRLLLVQ
jgi:hypothetical protein